MASATCEKKHYHEGFKLRAYATLYIVYIYTYLYIQGLKVISVLILEVVLQLWFSWKVSINKFVVCMCVCICGYMYICMLMWVCVCVSIYKTYQIFPTDTLIRGDKTLVSERRFTRISVTYLLTKLLLLWIPLSI